MRFYFPLLWMLAACQGNYPKSHGDDISFVAVRDYRYMTSCGNPVYYDTIPTTTGRGEYNVYVMKDSSDLTNCIAPVYPAGQKQSFPMRSGKDFLLIVEMKDAPGWGMDVSVVHSEGRMLELRLVPVRQDKGVAKEQYIWHFAADEKQVVKLLGGNSRFAYAKGPAWKPGKD